MVAQSRGANGAVVDYVPKGTKKVGVYVDDDNSGCASGMSNGPKGAVPRVGSSYDVLVP